MDIRVNKFVKVPFEGRTTIRRIAEINGEEVKLVGIDKWFSKSELMPPIAVGDRVIADVTNSDCGTMGVVDYVDEYRYGITLNEGGHHTYDIDDGKGCTFAPTFEPTEDMSPLTAFFESYGVPYTPKVVEMIENEAYEAKSALREKFSQHPNWDEKRQAIIIEKEIELPIDYPTAINIAEGIGYSYSGSLGAFMREVINYNVTKGLLYLGDRGLTTLHTLVGDDYKGYHSGMKATRFIRSIFEEVHIPEKCENFERDYAKMSDSLSIRKIKRTFVLSLNLLDFMSMSHGNSWHSCHSVEHRGCYHGGTLSYALDNVTAIMYTLESKNGINNNAELWKIPKITRQLFMFDKDWLLQSRCYPSYTDLPVVDMHMDFVLPIYKTLWGDINSVWDSSGVVSTFCTNHIITHGLHYPDYIYPQYNCRAYFRVSPQEIGNMAVGHKSPDTVTGEENQNHRYLTITGSALSVYTPVVCADCGRVINLQDDDSWIRYGRNYYCDNCTVYCEHCDDRIPIQYATEYNGDYYCDNCIEENFRTCDNCGELVPYDDVYYYNDEGYCYGCYNDLVTVCNDCGDEIYRDDTIKIDGKYYCSDCAEEIREEEEQEDYSSEVNISDEDFEKFKNGEAVIDISDHKAINNIMQYLKEKNICWSGNQSADTSTVMLDIKRVITSGVPVSFVCRNGSMYYGAASAFDIQHITPIMNGGD